MIPPSPNLNSVVNSDTVEAQKSLHEHSLSKQTNSGGHSTSFLLGFDSSCRLEQNPMWYKAPRWYQRVIYWCRILGVCVCVHSHSLLVELIPDASRHVFEDSNAARHQLQLLILLLHDQLNTQTHTSSFITEVQYGLSIWLFFWFSDFKACFNFHKGDVPFGPRDALLSLCQKCKSSKTLFMKYRFTTVVSWCLTCRIDLDHTRYQ